MQRGKENYGGKEIVILGGGDGALLYELLKEKPKFVYMLEIDEKVMEACNKYMKSICGEVLEQRSGDNYEIIVGDCMLALNKFIKDGKKFDYVFGDLTDIPISDSPSGEIWNFIRLILETSFKVLKNDGKYMTHVSRKYLISLPWKYILNLKQCLLFREMVSTVLIPYECTKSN